MPSVLDQIEKALTEESALYPPMSSMARKEWSLARDRTEKLLRNHAADLIAVCKAAQEPASEIVSDELMPKPEDWRPRFPALVAALAPLLEEK